MNWLRSLIGDHHPLRLLWHWGKMIVAASRAGFPAKKLTVIGITGTDGKTTTTGMVAHILAKTGHKTAAASTAFTQVGEEIRPNPTHLTSLSPAALQGLLKRAAESGCTHAVVEASSHGLTQHRLDCTWPSVAAITNLTLEHLDYHGTMAGYMQAKARLFRMLRPGGTKVLNRDDQTWPIYRTIPSAQTVTFGTTPEADISLEEPQATDRGSSAQITVGTERLTLNLSIPGLFNLQNAACAVAIARALGIPAAPTVAALASFPGIPGRLERIDEGQPFSVFVDFAVSPNSYEQTLKTLRSIVAPGKRVLVLCSSCGNRMQEKRPVIGKICGELADVVVVTEDETYGEDPLKVLEEVWAGIGETKAETHKIPDRREALRAILAMAQPGDAVVACGMGPFDTMTTLQGRIPWDERQIVRGILRQQKV